jgi:hypothetical protein
VATGIFLRPIFRVLGEVREVRSAGQISLEKRLEKTKWMTLAGASLAVVSSTAVYINFGLFAALGANKRPFYANPYLNVIVFGFNLDSVLNDIGMLFVCGVFETVSPCGVMGRVWVASKGLYVSQPVGPEPIELRTFDQFCME